MPKQKITQQFVERITPPEKGKIDYFDTETPGLVLKVLSSGTKTFSCRYRDTRGKQLERKLGSARVLKLSDAREQVLAIQAKLAMGEDPFEARRTLKDVPTFAAFVETAYMPHIKGYKRSWETDETLLRNHVLPKIGGLYLDEIKRQHRISIRTVSNGASRSTRPARPDMCRSQRNCCRCWRHCRAWKAMTTCSPTPRPTSRS